MTSRLVLIVLGVSLLLVGGRTMLAAQSALGVDSGEGRKGANRRQDTLVYEVSRGDSLIKNIGSLRRSPFAAPPVRIAAPTTPRKSSTAPPAAAVTPPRAILLMQDGNSTTVQLEVDGESSPWMSIGSSFRGWTLVGVTDRGILVTNGSSTYNLARP